MTLFDEMIVAKNILADYASKPDFSSMYFGGIPIYINNLLTEAEEYEDTEALTFKQRWIDPVRHCSYLPFEPWVKTRVVMRTRQVPSRKAMITDFGIFIHPAMKREFEACLKA